jgi:1-deoxy-D-xylulose-5-phosphate reductoisomerase
MAPDYQRFPALKLAYDALAAGESMPAVMNAANEVAVEAFLQGKIGFTDIATSIARTMDNHEPRSIATVEDVLSFDLWARGKTRELLGLS